MYQNIFLDKKTNTVHLWDDKHGYTTLPYASYAYRQAPAGKYKSIYGDALEKVTRFYPNDPSLYESDVNPYTRILIDLYGDSDDTSTGHKTAFIDIEVSSEGGFPNIKEGDKQITAIAVYDSVTEKYHAFILDIEEKIDGDFGDVDMATFSNENDLLMAFFTFWEKMAPTIVTGWNIDGFDMPYLYNRTKRVLGKRIAERLSPIGIAYMNDFSGKMVIAGISCLDYMSLYKKYVLEKEPSYALGAIGKKVVKIEKISYKGSLNDLYKEDINKYIEYNLNDVKIVVALDEKLQFIELARAICHTGHVPYDNFEMSSRYIEGAILTYLRRQGLVAPNKPVDGREEYSNREESDEEGFSGAYVKDPVAGRYEWIFDLDLTSMYPNIIISLNISPETKIGKVTKIEIPVSRETEKRDSIRKELEDKAKTKKDKIIPDEILDDKVSQYDTYSRVNKLVTKYILGSVEYSAEDFEKLLKEENLSISSNGVLYAKDHAGVIPTILIKWFDERKEMRKLAKKFADEKNWEKYEFYDQRQKVQKILLNSAYGVLGLPIFRFYDKDNAEAVTTSGVDIIKSAGNALNRFFKEKLELPADSTEDNVIYVDTDSCFASALPIIQKHMPEVDVNDEKQMTDAILKVCSEAQKYVNKNFDVVADTYFNITKHRFDAKQEVIAKTGFWLVKKRYTQLIINKGGIPVDEIEIKGIDVVRSSFPLKFRTFMNTFLINLLKKVDKKIIDDSITSFEDNMVNLPILDLAKNTSVKFIGKENVDYNPKNRPPFTFINKSPAQVKAALGYNDLIDKMGLSKKVQKIINGQKIKWVYLLKNPYELDNIAIKGDGTDPDEIMEFIEMYIDRTAMYNQELKSKLLDFYKVLNWQYPSGNQKLLEEYFTF